MVSRDQIFTVVDSEHRCLGVCHYPAVSSPVQESQVSVEVAIPQRYHRAIMGPKGCRIQHITREHEVQIKFPERDDSAAGQKRGN